MSDYIFPVEGKLLFKEDEMVCCRYATGPVSTSVEIGFVKSWTPTSNILYIYANEYEASANILHVAFPEQHGNDRTDRVFRYEMNQFFDTHIQQYVPFRRRRLVVGEVLRVDCLGYKMKSLVVNQQVEANKNRYVVMHETGEIEKFRSAKSMFINPKHGYITSAKFRLPSDQPEFSHSLGHSSYGDPVAAMIELVGIRSPEHNISSARQFYSDLHTDRALLKKIGKAIAEELDEGIDSCDVSLFDGFSELLRDVAAAAT